MIHLATNRTSEPTDLNQSWYLSETNWVINWQDQLSAKAVEKSLISKTLDAVHAEWKHGDDALSQHGHSRGEVHNSIQVP